MTNSMDPDLVRRAEFAANKGSFGDAARELNEAILKQDESNTAAMLRLARIYKEAGKDERALQLYDAVLAIEPNNRVAKNGATSVRGTGRAFSPDTTRIPTNVILQPCGTATPKRNFRKTIRNRVPFELIERYVSKTLLIPLIQAAGGKDDIMVWAFVPAIDSSGVREWNKIQLGDLSTFISSKRVTFVGRVVGTLRNTELGASLWPGETKQLSDGTTVTEFYELLYFMDEGVSCDFPLAPLAKALGRKEDLVLGREVRPLRPAAVNILVEQVPGLFCMSQ